MKKRILSWLLVLTMVTSLIPSTLVSAWAADLVSPQAVTTVNGKTIYTMVNELPTNSHLSSYDVVDVRLSEDKQPGGKITVPNGKTLILHGTGGIADGSRNDTIIVVENGGHLVLDEVLIQNNTVGSDGAIYVKSGGLLDLGYNDQSDRRAPSITSNTYNSAARNLTIEDGATVRLNAEATKPIGLSYYKSSGIDCGPFIAVAGGRYTMKGTQEGNIVGETNITSDDSAIKIAYSYDSIIMYNATPRVLVWDPVDFWTYEGTTGHRSGAYNVLKNYHKYNADLIRGSSTKTAIASTRHLTDAELASLPQYDLVVFDCPFLELTEAEKSGFLNYLNNGGRILVLVENAQSASPTDKRNNMNTTASKVAQELGANFTALAGDYVSGQVTVTTQKSPARVAELTKDWYSTWNVTVGAYITSEANVYPLATAKTTKGNTSNLICDQDAGDRDGSKWGAMTIVGDADMFWNQPLGIGRPLLKNLVENTISRRISAAAGVNPNSEFNEWQATTTTTEATNYRTPYAALQKAVEDNLVTLLLASRNGEVDSVSNELLFEKSTLGYENGGTYASSKIHADTSGVYIDITKTGEVNLRSGTVTVTPVNAQYELTLGGTGLNADGSAIEGGYKITASNAYTLDADDADSPIPAAQGGGASITLTNKGDSVTVEYGAPINKAITYTAQEANEKIYLGYYRVNKNVGSNVTWTDDDYAWHGKTFTTTATANSGWELDGNKLTVADTEGTVIGVYTLENTGTETDGEGNKWTVYSSKELGRDGTSKVIVKQQHLGGEADRQGNAKVIVKDVRGDVTIGATGEFASAAAAYIYVVGIGRKDGQETQLWEYTTVRNSKDGDTIKPVNGWPWEKWKVAEAGSGLGGQNDYQNNTDKFKDSFAKDATKLDTTSATAKYTIDLTLGDQVVVFYYDWNMTEVTIKATDANGDPIPDYTDQKVEYELDKLTTINAPNLIGYQPKADNVTKDFKPTKDGDNTVTFVYEKTTGNLTYRAVYEDANGVEHELGTFSGGVLVKGQKPTKSAQYAPQFDNYELVDANADGEASADVYNGTDITVTYKYQPKTKDIAVYAYAGDDEATGMILSLDKTSYKGMTTGQTITITAPEIAGYKVKGADSKTFFISNDKSENQDVKFFYEKDDSNEAYVLVQLVDSSNSNKVISEYQVPGIKGKAQLIKAPAAPYGYKDDPASPNEDQTVTLPDTGIAPYTKTVVFKYIPNVHTVTVVLKDVSTDPATILTVNNFVDTYKVVDGESLKITAPSIYGYTMAANAEAVKELKDIKTDTTVTFEYEPIDKQLVTIHVKGQTADGKILFESRETVTHGTASKEVAVFTIPGYKLATAAVNTDGQTATDKTAEVSNGKLTVSLNGVAKGGTVEVVLTYESNMANVTVKAMYNGTELQSYTIPMEKGVLALITPPSVPGYTAKEQNKQLTPDKDAEEVVFNYTKNNGNITVIVKADGQELYSKDGGTVANGSKIDLTGKAAAPTIEYYTTPSAPSSVTVGGTEVKDDLTTYEYDGSSDIIVTYEYTRKTQNVTIIKKDVDTGAKIEEQELTGLPVGKSHTFTDGSVKVPDHYQAVADRNPDSYFVEDKPNQTVTFWYKNTSADQYAQVTVNLICDDDGTIIQSYPVTAIKGVETTINAPDWTGYGYELAAGQEKVKTVTPDGTADNDKVEFHYTIKDPKYVKVELKDNSNNANPDLNAPAKYITSYTLKMGDSVTIWAPAIDGYSLMSATLGGQATANKQMVQADYATLGNGTTTVTFSYMPVAKANFVTHTIKFMMGTQELYSYEKLVQKGNGAVVSYPSDAVADMIPGYTYSHTTYNGADDPTAVKDNADATIVYYFVEDVAKITIKFQDASGNQLTQNGNLVPNQELTGYRKGQTVQVAAPVKDGFALVSDLIKDVTLNSANTEVIFQYAAAGDVTFTLKELNADGTEGSIIAVINGEANETYDAKATDGNPLDLSKYGYTYEPSNLTQAPFDVGGSGKVENLDMSQKMAYTVFYTKNLINVEFVPVNKTKLDDAKTTLEDAIKDGTVDTYKITELTPVTPEKARVGETYKAVAQSFNGWALKDSFSKLYEVKAGDTSLKVYFLYEQKTTGTVTVYYHFGTGADNKGEKLNEYTITAVAGEKLRISAPDYLMENKYHLRTTNTNPLELTVTENGATVDFYYEANFVIVTTKVFLDGTDSGTHETYEVIKDINITPNSGSTTIYPPDKAGYTLVGIEATGATLTNGGTEKLPDEYTNNQLTLTGLTQNATVNYYYKTTKASEYQTELTVEYEYNGYDLATAKKINANTGEANSIEIPAFDGYTASTYTFTDGSTVKANGSGVNGTTVSVTPAEKTATLTITYTRPDGSVVLPGEGGKIGDNDDIVVKPTDPNNPPTLNPGPDPAEGSATIPDNTTGTVTRPDPTNPDDGKEDIIVPGGTTIDPDGTIHLPKNPDGSDGGEIKPGQKIPDALPDTYVAITYDSNNGTKEVKKEIGKKGDLQVKGSLFTHPNNAKFVEWNTSGLGSGTTYAEGKKVDDSITLYAKWSARSYTYSATITYKPNGGTPDQDVFQNVGHDTDPNLKATLQNSPFQLSGWLFGGWCEAANGTGKLYQPNAILDLKDQDAKVFHAQWYRVGADGSITVPGKDGDPKNADTNATAKGNGTDSPKRDEATGNIEIPKGGSVVTPDGIISMPDGGTLKPDGTVIINRPDTDKDGKSDGTITIPGTNGKPDVKDENGTADPNAEVFTLTYTINNGENTPDVKVMVVQGDTTSTISNPFTWAGHIFLNWMREGDGKEYAAGADITVTADDTFHAQWAKGVNPDGSIELPGKDGILDGTGDDGTDHAKDNVTVTPADPDKGGKLTPQPDGSVKVDDTNGGTVTRPDPANPDSKEDIKVPEGTVVEPDGTIKLPDGTEIDPDQRIPDDVTLTDYYVVTYNPGEGHGDVIRQIVEKDASTTLLGADTFTAPNGKIFDGWLDELDSKHDADSQVAVMKNTTLTAQWKDNTPTPPAPQYSADIVFDSNNGDTATQTVTSTDSETITRNLDPYTQHFTAPADWTFMGWSTAKAASQSSTFYKDEAKVTLKDGDTLNLYAIVYKVDADTDIITLPGKGGQPDDGDDVTVTPGADAGLAVKEGYIEAPAGSEIKQPASNDPIKVIEGSVNVYPDGSVYVPDGSKVQLPDGTTIEGEATIDPDGNPDTDNTKPVQKPDGTIVLPGEDGVIGTGDDDITIKPAGPNQPAGRIDEDGNVTITNPDGADVNLPGNNPEDVKVPNGTVIKPNGDMTLLYTIRYVDGNGTEIKTATVKPVQRGVPETVEAAVINGYKLNDTATKTASGEVSANLADYTITFTYAKENSGGNNGGSTGGGGGGGGSVSSSFVIKASAGNGGIITPSGNVTVARGKDQSFTINPINGYRISDVIVDGKSIGTASTYTFETVTANHSIEVKFVKLNAIVADPEVTGVAGWLQTREHIAYLGGYGNGLFGPNDNMTRAQAAQMFYNLLLEKNINVTASFSDVAADAWYAKAVNTLASLGIIKGIGNDQFAPNRTITRAEFTVIAMRFANVAADVQNPFTDVTESAWYYTAVTSATSYGWINGYSDGTFRPYATITRAEVATIVNRMLNRAADRDFVDSNVAGAFTDVPKTYWGFYAIMEATTSHDHTIDNDGVETWNALK